MRAPAPPTWPLVLAGGTLAGVAAVHAAVALGDGAATTAPGPAGAALGAVLAIGAVVVAALAVRAASPSGARAARVAPLVLVAVVAASAGAWRAAAWHERPDPWGAQLGQELEIAGRSDGQLLWVHGRGALVVRGAELPQGAVRVRGTVESLPGRRNPGGVDLRGHWRRRGAWAAVRVVEVLETPPRRGPRDAVRRGVVAGLPPEAAALVQAMTLGIRDDLGSLRGPFAASGLAHVLALSGLHVGVLVGAVAVVLARLGRWRPPAVALATLVYVGLVGPTPSVVRASAMVLAVAAAASLGAIRPPLVSALALAAAGSLLAAPGWALDLGFQLSYASVAGIAAFAPALLRRAPRPRRRSLRPVARAVVGALAVSVSAQAATGSLVASAFGGVPLAAPVANLLAVPLAGALVPLGFLAGLTGLLHEGLARTVNLLVAPLATLLVATARVAARLPSLPWGEVRTDGHIAYVLGLAALAAALHGRLRPRRAAAVALVAIGVSAATPAPHAVPELVVLDVGQGDAIVVRVAPHRAVLVDGGGSAFADADVGARVVVPALRAMGVHALDVIVATHADLDHVQGLPAVLAALPVGEVWIGHREDDRPAFSALVEAAALARVPVREVRRGQSATLGRVRLDVLHPIESRGREPNEDSVALVVRVDGAAWALLAGDVPAHVEAELAVPPLCTLVAPHHGSATSTSADLLRAAGPAEVLISVGRTNRYGHPAPSVMARIDAVGALARTTRDEGAIRLSYPHPCPAVESERRQRLVLDSPRAGARPCAFTAWARACRAGQVGRPPGGGEASRRLLARGHPAARA